MHENSQTQGPWRAKRRGQERAHLHAAALQDAPVVRDAAPGHGEGDVVHAPVRGDRRRPGGAAGDARGGARGGGVVEVREVGPLRALSPHETALCDASASAYYNPAKNKLPQES